MKIGLDIDGVICDFTSGFLKAAKLLDTLNTYPESAEHVSQWDIPNFQVTWPRLKQDPLFWRNLEPYPVLPFDFEVEAYITARPVSCHNETLDWLKRHGFPNYQNVYSVESPSQKIAVLKQLGIDVFVDDKPETVRAVQEAGITAFLYYTPNLGIPRGADGILSLKELNNVIKERSINR